MPLVYLSPVPWASFAQRPHHFVRWYRQRRGGAVLWVDPYPTRLPDASDLRALTRRGGAQASSSGEDVPHWLRVLRPRALPLEPLPGLRALNGVLWRGLLGEIDAFAGSKGCVLGVGKPSRLALEVLARHPGAPSFYDAMDNFPAFYRGLSRLSMDRCERELAARCTRITVSSTALERRFASHSRKLSKALNACVTHGLPPVSAAAPAGRPVLGYVGTIGRWFDWGLVTALAEAAPEATVRLVGPVHAPPPGPLPGNVELAPPCGHAEALRHMTGFSAGLIPFRLTELSASVDPIKYYEYRSLGLPVLSTRFGEMALRGDDAAVFFLETDVDPAEVAQAAMQWRRNEDDIMDFRARNSWEARFDASFVIP